MPQNPEVRMSPSGPVISSAAGADFNPLTLSYYVDASYDGSAGVSNGSISRPFTTIQDGYDALAAEDGTLLIVSGNYDEVLALSGSRVKLVSISVDGDAEPRVTVTEIAANNMNFFGLHGISTPLIGLTGYTTIIARECMITNLDGTAPGVTGSVELVDSSATSVQGSGLTLACKSSSVGTITVDTLDSFDCDHSADISVASNATIREASFLELDISVAGDLVYQDCGARVGSTSASDARITNSDLENLIALSATLIGVTGISTLKNTGASGAPHGNPPFNIVACLFGANPVLESAGGGASFDVYMDEPSRGNFYQQGGTFAGGGTVLYQYGAVGSPIFIANDSTATVATSADDNYHVITGNAFSLLGSGNPWTLTAEGCIATYEAAYAGPGTPPPSPSIVVVVELTATVISAAGGLVGIGVALEQDIVGADITNRSVGQQLADVAAGVATQITTRRSITLAAATEQEVQPVFASDSGDNLSILSLSMAPIQQGWLIAY